MEFVIRVPFAAFLDELSGTVEHPTIDFLEPIVRKRVVRGIEIAKVAESKEECVTNIALGFTELGHHALAHFYVGLVFDLSDRKANQISTPSSTDLERTDSV